MLILVDFWNMITRFCMFYGGMVNVSFEGFFVVGFSLLIKWLEFILNKIG